MHIRWQWKYGGVPVLKRNELDINTAQTPRMNRSAAVTRGAGCIAAAMAIGVALCVLGPPPAAAQSASSAPQINARPYAFTGFALFGPDSNDSLQGQRGNLGWIAGGGYRFSPSLSFEVGVLIASQRLDTPASAAPAPGTFKDGTLRTSIGTGGLNIAAKYSFSLGRIEPYVGAGVGRYTTRFRTTSEASSCLQNCEDTGPRVDRISRNTGYHAVLGADYHLRAQDVIAVEFRYLKLDASFEDTVPGKVKAGGSFLWLGYRRYF
jgi:opacity protein-like surface antigen